MLMRMDCCFSFDPAVWWPLLLSTAAIKGHARLPASRTNVLPTH